VDDVASDIWRALKRGAGGAGGRGGGAVLHAAGAEPHAEAEPVHAGRAGGGPFAPRALRAHRRRARIRALGRAVRVDPIKPTLKAPGTERLKLKYEELLSNFGLKFNSRRYISALYSDEVEAGAYTRPFLSSTWAVSDTKYTLKYPTPPTHPLNDA
jgi:hypothetical protein